MSTITFEQPTAADGTLPVRLFGEPLRIGDLAKLGIRWYQNYALKDDLVTPACATAGNRFLAESGLLESVPFAGGHVGLLTSPYARQWPVNGRFSAPDGTMCRGPVLFQLDVSKAPAPAMPQALAERWRLPQMA